LADTVVFNLLLDTAPSGSSPLGSSFPLLSMLLIFGIFYFLLFLPMQKQRKQTAKMLSELQNGDSVVTSGGILGTVVALDAETVTLRVKPDNIKIQMARSAVSGLIPAAASSEGKK
jgi:preprotein translocase subunit YajC